MKRDITKVFIDEIYSKPPRKNYPKNKITNNHIDQIWSIDVRLQSFKHQWIQIYTLFQ